MGARRGMGAGSRNIPLGFPLKSDVQTQKEKRHPIVFGFKAGLRRQRDHQLLQGDPLKNKSCVLHPSILPPLFQALDEFLCEAQVEELHGG